MLKLNWGAALLAIAIAQSATGAAAGTADSRSSDHVQVVVRYGDLNLATPEGAHALRARADRAAMLVKGGVFPLDLTGVAELRKARAAALAAADAIIAAHAPTAYAETRSAPSELHL